MLRPRLSAILLAASIACGITTASYACQGKLVEVRSVGVFPDFDAVDVEKLKPGKYKSLCIKAQDRDIKFLRSNITIRTDDGDVSVAIPSKKMKIAKNAHTGSLAIPGNKRVAVKQIRLWYETVGGITGGTAKAQFYVQ